MNYGEVSVKLLGISEKPANALIQNVSSSSKEAGS